MEYIVNTQAQASGEHEVHKVDACNNLPDWSHRKALGEHGSCEGAMKIAQLLYSQVDGCKHCCLECHTR